MRFGIKRRKRLINLSPLATNSSASPSPTPNAAVINLFLRRVLAHVLRDLHEQNWPHIEQKGELSAFLGRVFVVVSRRLPGRVEVN